jgi:hypothetical protein
MSLAGSNKIRTEHLMCLIRNDAKKLGRAKVWFEHLPFACTAPWVVMVIALRALSWQG